MRHKPTMWARLVALLAALGCTQSRQSTTPRSNPKAFVEPVTGYLVLQGRCDAVTSRAGSRLPPTNSVEVNCIRAEGVCRESLAILALPSDTAYSTRGETYLFARLESYQIIEWTNALIVARSEGRAADAEIRITVQDRSAERTFRETGRRGAQGADPTPHQWVLR